MSMWHNDGSNISTVEKKTLKIYHVLEDLNYGIFRIYCRVLEENLQKDTCRLSEKQVLQKISHIARLRHLENHTEAVDLFLVN